MRTSCVARAALVPVLLLGALLLGGCAGEVETTSEDDPVASEDELRTAAIKSIEVSRSTGFRPPPPPGQCQRAGTWAVDFTTKVLTSSACIDGTARNVNRALTAAEIASVRTAVSNVRTTARPTSCPTDAPVSSLSVHRAQSSVHYVDARSACGGGSTPVRESTLQALVAALEALR